MTSKYYVNVVYVACGFVTCNNNDTVQSLVIKNRVDKCTQQAK